MDDLKQFRQWGSKTPGHPENFETEGIEVTTGPLGMGVSNAVGLAAAEAHMAAVYNKPGMPLIDHYTYCIMGDGCLQEGISHESCAYAGHLGLGKLIAFWDDNGITIDGHTELSFTEDVCKRYEAYGWQVLTVKDGNKDVDGIRKAIAEAKACTDKPTLIQVKTVIGYGSPNKADSHDAHGAPLGADEAQATRDQLGWKHGEFEVPQSVYDVYSAHAEKGAKTEEEWNKLLAEYESKEPELAAQFKRVCVDKTLPEGWMDVLPKCTPDDKGKATRLWSQDCLNALANVMPELVGGSADLAPSNMTLMKCTGDFLKGSYEGRNMRFGIREFGMGAVCNAVSLHKTGLIPHCATFTIFSDYMRNAIRLSALAQCGTVFVTTHDSIAVGEDGPTHQPIETIPSLRMIPDLTVIRPADANETSGAYAVAVENSKMKSMPTFLALTRQALPNLPNSSIENVKKGAYAVIECEDPELILVATGSEVSLIVDAAKEMGKKVRVVSMPCWELFRAQPAEYKDSLLPKGVPTMSVEAAVTMGWGEWATAFVGIDCFGASAPGGTCLDKFGFNVSNVVACAEKCMGGATGVLSNGSQGKH
jgi:transketolase